MVTQKTPFDPVVNGFKFVNYFMINQPVKLSLPIIGETSINVGQFVFGLCGGMSYSALDYFNHQLAVPIDNNPAALNPTLYNYLVHRQVESLENGSLQKLFTWMLLDGQDLDAKMVQGEVPNLRNFIDHGSPVSLALLRVTGLNDPTHNHQVVAIGYDFDPDTQNFTIHLYDPNHPGESPQITLNLANPSAGINLAQSTGEPLRAFFVTNYTVELPPQ